MSLSGISAKTLLRHGNISGPQQRKKDIPEDFGKMPADYDFGTRKKNWHEYSDDFILRTDAVWEKYKLRDLFRLYMKCFYYDKLARKYMLFEPEDIYTITFEPWALEDMTAFSGFTPTGRTQSFQIALGPKQRTKTPAHTNFIKADFYDLCALRFEKWFRCDMVYYDLRAKEYDMRPDQENYKKYPCYREYYEASYACQDDLFDFLMELHYAKQAADWFPEDVHNFELTQFPTVWDTPDAATQQTLTY